MADLPIGTITYMFTDVEGSTRLWQQHHHEMRNVMARHDSILTSAVEAHSGTVVRPRGEGDSIFAVFLRATDAVGATCAAQQLLLREPWAEGIVIKVRMALHTGESELREHDYYGAVVNRCARLRSIAHGGQVVLSQATAELVQDTLPEGVQLRDIGVHRLQDMQRSEQVFQLLHPDLPSEFPPLKSRDGGEEAADQQIRFCTSSDGVSICYATVGEGPPLVKAPNWLSHLEYDWRSPVWRHWWEELSKDHLLIRFDQRGCGLSDWSVEDISFEARVRDLEAVVEALELERFALLGISQGGAAAAEYAVRHPEKVSHLVIYGGYAQGPRVGIQSPEESEEREALLTLMRRGWGREDPTYRQVFTANFIPEATAEQMDSFNELQRVSVSPENAVRTTVEFWNQDVSDRLPQVSVPTLVLHGREDRMVSFEQGRRMATLIPNAHFVPLDSKNHILIESEPAWPVFLSEVRRFLGTQTAVQLPAAPPGRQRAVGEQLTVTVKVKDKEVGREAYSLIDGLDSVSLSRFSVVPGYARFDEVTRNVLKDARQEIAEGLERPGRKRENHLFWAAPGSGKTYFVQQTVASLPGSINYQEINLAACGEMDFLSLLGNIENGNGPCLCFIDELDAKPEEAWPYEVLLPRLDAALERAAPLVFLMAGSSGSSIEEMKQRIGVRPKGMDLLSRIPSTNEHQIPAMSVGDRLLVALTQFREAAKESGKMVKAVEKLGLYYVAVTPGLANARQLREFAVRAVERIPAGEDRIKYDNLFSPGDLENKIFWSETAPVAGDLVNRFVAVED